MTRPQWVERYRPNSLDDIVGQDEIIEKLKEHVEKEEIPNLLFAGPSGVGKTASAVAIAKDLYGDNYSEFILELNASDDRGIDVVRDRIKEYANTSLATGFQRIIFLDESDALTDDAQAALRRTMEQYTDRIIFILSCNYPRRIIPAIQSRCVRFQFGPIDDYIIQDRLVDIADKEDITITNDGLDAITYIADGDMRKAIYTLQTTSIFEDVVEEEDVFSSMSYAYPDEIKHMILLAGSGKFEKALDELNEQMDNKGIDSGTILDVMHDVIWDLDIDDELMVNMANHIGETDYRITEGANTDIQMQALLSEFTLMGKQ